MQLVQVAQPTWAAAVLADPLAVALDDLALRLHVHCLVEAADGSVVAHALRGDEPPPLLVTAVLRRAAGELTGSLSRQRSIGLLPGGPLLTAQLPGWTGTLQSAPLVRGGQRLGWLWLLADEDVAVDTVATAAAAVAAACRTAAPDEGAGALRAALEGHQPLPTDVVGRAQHAWVVSISGAPPEDLRLALEARRRPPRLQVASYPDRVRAVLLTTEGEDAAARAQLHAAVRELQEAVAPPLRAGFSEPADAAGSLRTVAAQADAACRASGPGGCSSIRDVRAQVVLDLARTSLLDLPDLGPDPVALLREHDQRRGTDLSRTVRCWLDAGGDVAATAGRLLVHPNTLRYRLKCAQAVAGVSFDDLSVRLELHLRLGP